MKVEQLKAELVVFKGLMSNVSADFPLGSQEPSGGLPPLPVGVPCATFSPHFPTLSGFCSLPLSCSSRQRSCCPVTGRVGGLAVTRGC